MKSSILKTLIVTLVLGRGAFCEPPKPDVRNFELTPAAPSQPLLKHQFLFDDLGDRRPGNAALLYHDAILLMGPDVKQKTDDALAAWDAKDTKKFDELADGLALPNVIQELDLAGRREHCDWEPPFREMGAMTLLPHLEPLAHAATRLVKIRALRLMEQGKLDESINMLRLGYEMANNVAEEGILISGLVSLHITSQMNDAVAQLMNRQDAPNVYWALCEYPDRHTTVLRRAMKGERQWWVTATPNYLGLQAKAGEKLSAEQWRQLIDYIWSVVDSNPDTKDKHHPDPVKDAEPETLAKAREDYARTRPLTPEQAAAVDPMIVLGEFYFHQYQISFDEAYVLRDLPYPTLLARATVVYAASEQMHRQQRANPFLPVFNMRDTALRVGVVDRQLAALAAVEAIRAYAAANMGNLPARLEDVVETPVPQNPLTGAPFEYRTENDTATLADSATKDSPLTYTIRIRK
jgi:hypothetical protein